MKVALVLTQDRGGPVDLSVALALEVAARRDDVDVALVGPPPVSSAGDAAPMLHRAHVRTKTDRRGAADLRRVLAAFRPDVVHAQDRRAALVLRTMARPGAPVVATYHGVPDAAARGWVDEGPLAGRRPTANARATLLADALVARSVRMNVAPSDAMARFLASRLRVPATRRRVIRNGVALPPTTRRQPDRARRFVAVGSFAALKRMPALIESFARVAATRPDVELWLVGDGDDAVRCRALVDDLDLRDRVRFLGYRDDVPAVLAECDAFVLPSVNENLPLALLEAMAVGLACVASDVGGVGEAMIEGAGLLVRPGDDDALIHALARLADEHGLARQLGERAAAAARPSFGIERCAAEHVTLWREVAG